MDHYPDAYISMGLTAENIAKKYGISREQADEFSLASHQKALAAIAAGKFKDEIVPVEVSYTLVENGANGRIKRRSTRSQDVKSTFDTDEGPRADTSHGSTGESSSPLPGARRGHRGKQFADERRRGRRRRDERRKGSVRWVSSRSPASWRLRRPAAPRKKWASAQSSLFQRFSSWRV